MQYSSGSKYFSMEIEAEVSSAGRGWIGIGRAFGMKEHGGEGSALKVRLFPSN